MKEVNFTHDRTHPLALRQLLNRTIQQGPEALHPYDESFLKRKRRFTSWLSDLSLYLQETATYEKLCGDVLERLLANDLDGAERGILQLEKLCADNVFNPYQRAPEQPK